MSGGFTVPLDALDAHGRQLDALADRLRNASDAAAPLDILAYGFLCQIFATCVMESARRADRAVGGLAESGSKLPVGLRITIGSYRAVEDGVVESLRGPS